MGVSESNTAAAALTARESPLRISTGELLLWALIATITMLFAGFASAYLVRRAAGNWSAIAMPGILWFNTAVLVASSFAMEQSRSEDRKSRHAGARTWLVVTAVMGLVFVAGQLQAWRELVAQGVYLPSSPHSSFFYILTGLHILHLVGGMVFLMVALRKLVGGGSAPLRLCATYWHFLGGVWLFLVYLMFGM